MAARENLLLNPAVYLATAALGAIVVAAKWVFSGSLKELRERKNAIVKTSLLLWILGQLTDWIALTLLFLTGFLIVTFPFGLGELWPRVAQAMLKPGWRCLGLIVLVALSISVDFLRQAFERTYAVVEILVGLFVAWSALGSQTGEAGGFMQGIALAGSVYALVNGIKDLREYKKFNLFGRRS